MSDFFLSGTTMSVVVALAAVVPCAADSLSDYARKTPLARPAAVGASLVISNDTLDALAERGCLTTASPGGDEVAGHQGGPEARAGDRVDEEKKRSSWRRQHRRQAAQVETARAALRALDDRIEELDRRRFEAGPSRRGASLAGRLDELRSKRRQAVARLERERAELAAIVREARRDGAQPGWFR